MSGFLERFVALTSTAMFACCLQGDVRHEPTEDVCYAAAKENPVHTLRVRHHDGPRVGWRQGAAVLSGLIALVASTTAAFVLQVGRRRRGGGTEAAIGAAPARTELPTVRGPRDPRGKFTTTLADGIHAAAGPAPLIAGEQTQSVYGVGFDQHSAHARGRPIAWIVVAVVIAGTCVSGISLVVAAPWLFWTGVGVVVVGVILGRTTHALRDELAGPPHDASSHQPLGAPVQSRLAR